MSQKLKKKSRKKYERKNPTLKQQLERSESARINIVNSFDRSIKDMQDRAVRSERQLVNAHEIINNQYAEIAQLREKNSNLIEAINIISRASRMDAQSKMFNNYNEQLTEATNTVRPAKPAGKDF